MNNKIPYGNQGPGKVCMSNVEIPQLFLVLFQLKNLRILNND